MDLRDWRVFTPTIMTGYLVARILSVALHELAGHGIASALIGGSFYAVFISPASGFSLIFMTQDPGDWAVLFVYLAGIIVELVVGIMLYIFYRRMKDPLARLISLVFLQVLLFQTLLYVAFGALPETGGDTWLVASAIDSQPLQIGFMVVGVTLAIVVAYVLSVELINLLAPAFSTRKWLYILLLFWLFPLLISVALEGLHVFPDWPVAVITLVVSMFIGYAIGRRFSKRIGESGAPVTGALSVTRKDLGVLFVALVVLCGTWLGGFGLNAASAHGVLLQEPPLESEPQWLTSLAISLNVFISKSNNVSDPVDVTVEFKFKGLPDVRSPLLQKVWSSFESRGYLPYYEEVATVLAEDCFNVTGWNVSSSGIGGSVWAGGTTYPNARHAFLNLGATGKLSLLNLSNGNMSLVFHDAFRYPPPGMPDSFIDEVVVEWDGGFYLDKNETFGGSTIPEYLAGGMRWRNGSAPESPYTYAFTFRIL